jgi:ABC-type Na+ efflux pump permease subunit
MMMITSAWIIAKKEINLLFKSTRRIFLLFTTPLILFLIFGLMVFLSATILPTAEGPPEVLVIQADEGYSEMNWGDNFYLMIKTNNLTKNYVYVNESINNLDLFLQTENFSVLLFIPANFSEVINQSLPAQFFIYYDNSDINDQGVVSNILTVAQILNQEIIFHFHGLININRIFVLPEGISEDLGFEGFIASYVTLIPLYAILFLVVPSLSLVLISVTIEREQKTLESLILQPIERKSIIAGKLLYGAILVGFNTIITIVSVIGLIFLSFLFLPESIKSEIGPVLETVIEAADISVWIFILYILIGLILVSFLTITAAVLFSLMAKDEREANMVVSALVIIPLVSTFLIAFLPISAINDILKIILVLLPLLGYLFGIYISLVSGELPIISWLSLVAQLLWISLGIWVAGRLVESEGILEISYKRFFLLRRKK